MSPLAMISPGTWYIEVPREFLGKRPPQRGTDVQGTTYLARISLDRIAQGSILSSGDLALQYLLV